MQVIKLVELNSVELEDRIKQEVEDNPALETANLDELPDEENYETLAGFMMFKLRKIPRPADFVSFNGYKFEVVDVDHFKIDQLLVTRLQETMPEENLEEESE